MKWETEEIEALGKAIAAHLAPMLRPEAAPDPLLTCAEAGKILELSHETVRQLVNNGHIKRAKGIGQIRIRKSELDTYGK